MARVDGKLLVMKCERCHNTDYWSKRKDGKYDCHWCGFVQAAPDTN